MKPGGPLARFGGTTFKAPPRGTYGYVPVWIPIVLGRHSDEKIKSARMGHITQSDVTSSKAKPKTAGEKFTKSTFRYPKSLLSKADQAAEPQCTVLRTEHMPLVRSTPKKSHLVRENAFFGYHRPPASGLILTPKSSMWWRRTTSLWPTT